MPMITLLSLKLLLWKWLLISVGQFYKRRMGKTTSKSLPSPEGGKNGTEKRHTNKLTKDLKCGATSATATTITTGKHVREEEEDEGHPVQSNDFTKKPRKRKYSVEDIIDLATANATSTDHANQCYDIIDDDDRDDNIVDDDASDDATNPTSRFEVRQRVLARDEDGLMYFANIRRKLYGINYQKSHSALSTVAMDVKEIVGQSKKSQEEIKGDGDEDDDERQSEWVYFVHYEGWKTIWDRWVHQADILEATPQNVNRMQEIQAAHKALQNEFKEKTQKRKIQDAGLFIKMWKTRLDLLEEKWKAGSGKESANPKEKLRQNKTKRKKKSGKSLMQEQSQLALKSFLSKRKPVHAQALPLAFGLKRILVEDWEIVNAVKADDVGGGSTSDRSNFSGMVHSLPAQITVRDVLKQYLHEKGVPWDGGTANLNSTANATACEAEQTPNKNDEVPTLKPPPLATDSADVMLPKNEPQNDEAIKLVKEEIYEPEAIVTPSSDATKETVTPIVDPRNQEWTDMADGIVIYFEQALSIRLLYPPEFAQLLVMEDALRKGDAATVPSQMVDIYGCEHLLRLLSMMPTILETSFRDVKERNRNRKQVAEGKNGNGTERNTQDNDDEDEKDDLSFEQNTKVVMAKLQDLARFLQKNQSRLFAQRYRKLDDAEGKAQERLQKRQERRLQKELALCQGELKDRPAVKTNGGQSETGGS